MKMFWKPLGPNLKNKQTKQLWKRLQGRRSYNEVDKSGLIGGTWLLLLFWQIVTYHKPKQKWRVILQKYKLLKSKRNIANNLIISEFYVEWSD